MVSMASLRNRLAVAPSPSSPVRSRVFPSYLERFLKQLGKRNGHGRKTNQNRARSMSPAFRRTFAPFDCHRLGPKYHIVEYVCLGRFHHVGDGEMRIPPIPPEDIVHRRVLPGRIG
jgi:hypothetical protein